MDVHRVRVDTWRSNRWVVAGLFIGVCLFLQLAWIEGRGGQLERTLIDDLTVRSLAALINLISPQTGATAVGASVLAPGGGINVRSGCEGTEVLFPLLAALCAYPFSLRTRLFGTLVGTAFVFGLNQVRLLLLFFTHRDNPDLFATLHGLAAPMGLILCMLGFIAALLAWDTGSRDNRRSFEGR